MAKQMLNKISLKTKLLVPTVGLVSILVVFGTIIIVSMYSKMISLNELHSKVVISNLISDIIHSQQKERGLSSGYNSDKKNIFKIELLSQRKNTNETIDRLSEYLKRSAVEVNKPDLDILKSLREFIDTNQFSSDLIIEKYSALNAELLDTIVDIAKSSHIPIVTQNILAYSNLLYLKENVGLERVNGVLLLSNQQNTQSRMNRFLNLIAYQKQNEIMFLNYASDEIYKYYDVIKRIGIFKKVKEIEDKIKSYNSLEKKIDSKYWYDIMTDKLDLLDRMGKFIKLDTSTKIKLEIQNAKNIFYIVILLVLLSLVIFVFLLVAFVRLASKEQRLRIAMDKYVISSITNLQGVIIDVSEAFCKISGYSRNELMGKPHNIVRHPDMPKETYRKLWEKIVKGESWSGKVKNKRKDESAYWVYANIEPLYDKNGKIESYISIRLDITENELLILKIKEEEQKNKKQEKLMQQQHKLVQMGEMINMIAHQWRQPLSAISAVAGILSLKAKLNKLENEVIMELSDKIKNFSMQLSETIDDFRNFFKSNKLARVTNFDELYKSVFSIVENSLKVHNIQINKEIIEIQEFSTYDNELKQVLLNLIKNSEDALLENNIQSPYIKIIIDKNTFIISDNAGGIPDEIIDKIFDPYFSTKLKKDGTGLGLYMSKIIVEEHCKGILSVENTTEGARFKITIKEIENEC